MANKSNNKLTVYGTKRAKDQEPYVDYEAFNWQDYIGGPYSYVDKFYQDDAAEIIHHAKWSMDWRIKNAIDRKARIMVSDLMNGGKSFYGKARIAHVESKSGRIYEILISYNTAVAMLDSAGRFVRLWNGYSATTMKHIGAFMDRYKLRNIGKHEWLELPIGKPSGIAID
jgi:hypothetical protein